MPRLRSAANSNSNGNSAVEALPPSGDKPAGCAMPLTLQVSEGQRKKELALGISVRTGVGDSEEFESDTLEFMPGSQVGVWASCMCVIDSDAQPMSITTPKSTPLTPPPSTTHTHTTRTTHQQVNVTVPIVPCGETLIGIIVRIVGNQTAASLMLDRVSSTYMGAFQRSSLLCDGSPFVVNKYKTLIDLAPAV